MSAFARRTEMGSTEQILNDARVLRGTAAERIIPGNAVPFFADGSAPTPVFSVLTPPEAQVVLATYQVPIGWEGLLIDVMNTVTGDAATFIEGSGDVVWTIDIDTPLNGPLASGRFLPGYMAITRSLGNLQEPWPINRGWRMRTGETYRYKVYTRANVATGLPSVCYGCLMGLVWPQC